MKKLKLNENIVCDIKGCGRLSTYRLTFDKKSTVFLCDECLKEARDFFKNEAKIKE